MAAGVWLWRQVWAGSALVAVTLAAVAASMSCIVLGTSALTGVVAVVIAGAPAVVRPMPSPS